MDWQADKPEPEDRPAKRALTEMAERGAAELVDRLAEVAGSLQIRPGREEPMGRPDHPVKAALRPAGDRAAREAARPAREDWRAAPAAEAVSW